MAKMCRLIMVFTGQMGRANVVTSRLKVKDAKMDDFSCNHLQIIGSLFLKASHHFHVSTYISADSK
jgi:hypothetical protein